MCGLVPKNPTKKPQKSSLGGPYRFCFCSLTVLRASVSSGLPANIQLDVDGDRETERIYSLYSTYMTKLIKMEGQKGQKGGFAFSCRLSSHALASLVGSPAEACGSKSVYDGPEQEEYSSFVIDDPQETYKTLKQIVSAVQTLEQQHTKYRRDKFKKTKIGSQYVALLDNYIFFFFFKLWHDSQCCEKSSGIPLTQCYQIGPKKFQFDGRRDNSQVDAAVFMKHFKTTIAGYMERKQTINE